MAAVGVVIPAFNPGAMLGEALESLHRQSFLDWEAVVVDDGSSEDVAAAVRGFDVTLLRQENAGASVARNRGVLATTAPLVAFMDQDDLWMPDKLRHQVDAFEGNPSAALCYCDLRVLEREAEVQPATDSNKEVAADIVLVPGAPQGRSALAASLRHFGGAFVVPSTVMIRRDALAWSGLMDPWRPFTGDFDLLIRAGGAGPVLHVGSPDVIYRRHEGNFSGRYLVGRRELKQMRKQYIRHAGATDDRELDRAAREVLRRPRRLYAAQAFDGARFAWRRGDKAATLVHLYRSAIYDPRVIAEAARSQVMRQGG